MELSGQVAIVTGAGRGIGRATALELAQMGADVVVAEMDREGAERTAAEVKGLGRRVSVVRTDVTSRPDLKAMAERARAEFGRIDILINNAGIYRAALPMPLALPDCPAEPAMVVTTPPGVTLTLAGLRSRWMRPLSCAASSAAAICRAIVSAFMNRRVKSPVSAKVRSSFADLGRRPMESSW